MYPRIPTPPLDEMLVHRRVSPAGYPFVHLGGERHCESKEQEHNTNGMSTRPQPGLEPRPLAPVSSVFLNREGLGTRLLIMGLATIDPHSHNA